ncbi:MAG: sialidase family protein [Proteobacteria bacterium]|nr:sialidase family protein [Pseudomonadota bacterium]
MADRLFVGTRKGLFELARKGGGWDIVETKFLGEPVTAVLATPTAVHVALDLGHFGAKTWRKPASGEWQETATPAFPAKSDDASEDPHPWTLGRVWNLTPGGVEGRIWAGSMPGGLFRSDDNGETWSLCEPLWRMPDRRKWMGVAGGEHPGLSTVLVDPADPSHVTVGVSCAGVWTSGDAGTSWRQIGQGFHNEYMPPDQQDDPIAQDIHQLAQCPANAKVIWCQHHSGIYRSEDGGESFVPLPAAKPSAFGFAVAAHPKDPKTAWFAPAIKDEKRYPVEGKMVVSRTSDGGKSFDILSNGLPGRHAYDLVYRHALCVDETGNGLAIGSTSGGLWISDDAGESWTAPEMRLPPVACVKFEGS